MIVLAPDFMTKICKKAAQHFHCAVSKVFDRVKSVALWSANIRKLAKDHKGYGSTASGLYTRNSFFLSRCWEPKAQRGVDIAQMWVIYGHLQ